MLDRDPQLRQPSEGLPILRGTGYPGASSASGSSTQAIQPGAGGSTKALETTSLFSDLVLSPLSRGSVEFVPAVHSRLQAISLELLEGEQLSSIQTLLGPVNNNSLSEFLKYAAYLASNNMLRPIKCDQILKWFAENSNHSALTTLFSAKLQLPTIDAFARCLFEGTLRTQNAEVLRILLKAGVDPNSPTSIMDGFTPLQVVVSGRDETLVQTLLDAGADINALSTGRIGVSALHIALARPDVDMVKMLLHAGADVNVAERVHCNRTVLQVAAETGDVALVKFLLREGADVNAAAANSQRNNNLSAGSTALQFAAGYDERPSLHFAKLLLDAGANINAPPYWAPEEIWFEDCEEEEEGYGITALQGAAGYGNIELIQILLDAGADVNAPPAAGPWGGMTALQIAASRGMIESVRLLLSAGANVNAPATSNRLTGRTALQAAAEVGNLAIAQLLLEAGANINAPGYPALSFAFKSSNSLLLVPTLLDAGADVNGYGCSPLLLAIQSKQCKQLVPILLDAGADINRFSHTNFDTGGRISPLIAAATEGDIRLVELLLAMGADVNAAFEITALEMAISRGHLEIIEVLLSAGAFPNTVSAHGTVLDGPVIGDDVELVKILLSRGVNVNQYFPQDSSSDVAWVSNALPLTAISGNLVMAQLLLDAGAAVDASLMDYKEVTYKDPDDELGRTALLSAIGEGEDELTALLLRAGANVNARPQPFGGRTALQAAAKRGNMELVQTLLDMGAKVNDPAHADSGRTALQAASIEGHIDLVRFLLEVGADPNAAGAESRGVTALQGAAIQGHLGIALILIEADADPNAPSAKFHGRTALEGAAENGRLDMLQLLLNAGADIGGNYPERARDLALKNGHAVVAKVLEKFC